MVALRVNKAAEADLTRKKTDTNVDDLTSY